MKPLLFWWSTKYSPWFANRTASKAKKAPPGPNSTPGRAFPDFQFAQTSSPSLLPTKFTWPLMADHCRPAVASRLGLEGTFFATHTTEITTPTLPKPKISGRLTQREERTCFSRLLPFKGKVERCLGWNMTLSSWLPHKNLTASIAPNRTEESQFENRVSSSDSHTNTHQSTWSMEYMGETFWMRRKYMPF